MKIILQTLTAIFLITSNTLAQVDTLSIKQKVEALNSQKEKIKFWNELNSKDQTFRGPKSEKLNDLHNLIAASYFLNTYGYPIKEECGNDSAIISIIWVHNSFPEINRISFPIILQGFKSKHISEEDLRLYYLRNLYNRRFNDEHYRTKNLSTIFKELDLNLKSKISVSQILKSYNESEKFVNEDLEVYGHWDNPKSHEEVKILLSKENEFYLHKIYQDGSHYPQKLLQDSQYENLFRIHADSEFYFGIQENGDLSIKYPHGVRQINSIVE